MKKRMETKEWRPGRARSGETSESDRQLADALDQSISELAARYQAILTVKKKQAKIDRAA